MNKTNHETTVRLSNLYPTIEQCLPMKIGALKDFKIPLAPRHAKKMFAGHTRRKKYLEAIADPDSMRHDLHGNPVEPVSDDHRLFAQRILAKQERKRVKRENQLKDRGLKEKAAARKVNKSKPRPRLLDESPEKNKPTVIMKKRRRIVKPMEATL